jgi:hypothetical protein
VLLLFVGMANDEYLLNRLQDAQKL